MKKNNFENYNTENNDRVLPENIAIEQECSVEDSLEELELDFAEIENDYSEIVNNPGFNQVEKKQASVWMNRAKIFLYKGLALLSLYSPFKTEAQNESSLDLNKTKNEMRPASFSQENINSDMEKYKELGYFMAYNLASEKPTDYQLEQIKNLEDDIISSLNNKKFSSITEMVTYINSSISSDFSDQSSTIYIKDAFPEGPGQKAKGTFDCDARLLISLSILNRVGVTVDQVEFCLLKGHALLKINDDNVFFEMTNNDVRELTEEESLQLHKIDSFDKYQGYLLGKSGIAIASEAMGNVLRGEGDDYEKIDLATNKILQALELDPNNLTNNLNLLTLLRRVNNRQSKDQPLLNELVVKVSENVQRSFLNNYYGINSEQSPDKTLILQAEEINSQKIKPRRLEDLGSINDLTAKALSESDYLSREFTDLGVKLFYDLRNPEAALTIFEALASQGANSDKFKESSDYCFYQQMIASCYFNLNKYDKYLSLAQNELYNLLLANSKSGTLSGKYFQEISRAENLKISAANVIVGNIIINEETVGDFCRDYRNDPLLGQFISGRQQWHSSAIEAVEALRSWPGFDNMIEILDNWREKGKK